MKRTCLLLAGAFSLATVIAVAQPPGGRPKDNQGSANGQGTANGDSMVARLMALDKNKDGKLTKDEVTDERLHAMLDRADTDRDGSVDKAELLALFAKEASTGRGGPGGGQGGGQGGSGGGRGQGGQGGGPGGNAAGGPGGPGGGGPGGGPGGAGGRRPGGPPQPGQIMPPFLQDELRLTDTQKQQLADLQKEVDTRLETILTADPKQQLKEMQNRGPGGPGGPNGQGGPGGQGGRPLGGQGGRPPGGQGGPGGQSGRPQRDSSGSNQQ